MILLLLNEKDIFHLLIIIIKVLLFHAFYSLLHIYFLITNNDKS